MTSVEDQVRAATRAAAETLREVRPLRLPPAPGTARGARPARRFKGWIAPVTAAAAVVALAISLVLVREIPNGRAVPPAPPVSSSAVPRYYVALPGADNFANVPGAPTAVVGDTFTGKRLYTVRPSGADKFVSVSAAADDRTFVLGANPHLSPPAGPMATAWYLLRLTPGSGAGYTVSKLPIPAPAPDDLVDATALSPDGTELALAGFQDVPQPANAPQAGASWLRVYSVATGALLHSWSTHQAAFSPYTTLSWTAGGNQLAIGYTWSGRLGVRMLDAASQGHDLITDSRLAWSVRTSGTSATTRTSPLSCALALKALVTPDGKKVVCSAAGALRATKTPSFGGPACPAGPPSSDAGFLEYSTATGKLLRTLYAYDTNCVPGGIDTLWASPSGDKVIGYIRLGLQPLTKTSVLRFGVFSEHKFTPLPVPPTTETIPNAIAW